MAIIRPMAKRKRSEHYVNNKESTAALDKYSRKCRELMAKGKERPEIGEVLAIGPGRLSEHGQLITVRTCKVGDIVMVPKIGTLRVDFEGEEYYIAQDREILAVIKQTDE